MIYDLIKKAETNSNFSPTLLYNEGWMLRLVLQLLNNGEIECDKISFSNEFKWYSEVLLRSPFLPRFQGDTFAESHTHADGVVGKFDFRGNTKGGISLDKGCDFFYIIEAKMFSKLSKGTTHAFDYNQAARNIACLAHLIYENRETLEIRETDKFGFYVFLPQDQIKIEKTFREFTKPENLVIAIKDRISKYPNADKENRFDWLMENLYKFINMIDIKLISWEELLGEQNDSEIWKFYEKCLKYNKKK
ncbi:hypothetical protein [Mesoflavibacter zeaxanthinifaciens]|uniref:hypothetical protein n=1 Tax=Mesoflavibacter zeaxanthinifaciens TaxID=393060 RepID=UPI003A920352